MSSQGGAQQVGTTSHSTAKWERMTQRSTTSIQSNPALTAETENDNQQDHPQAVHPVEPADRAEWILEPEPQPSGVCLLIA